MPHRSYHDAMGLAEEQIHRPVVGVASCRNEAAPRNIALMHEAQSAKSGADEAGGTPREFYTITVTDGIAGCDKSRPGIIEAAAAELAACAKRWKAPPNPYQSGALRKCADQVGPARKGAVTHAGAREEVVCYADI